MLPKPAHLGPAYGAQFGDQSVVDAYPARPLYPAAVWPVLTSLAIAEYPILDVGTGTGAIARALAAGGWRVDALDPAPAMLAMARTSPGGDAATITWRQGDAETAPLAGPYGLITAGASLHWLDWPVALPRLRAALAPGAVLAIVDLRQTPPPWAAALQPLIARYSTNREFRPYDLPAELRQRAMFADRGRHLTTPVTFTQPLAAYIESFHARNGFSRQRMTTEAAAAFDGAVRDLVLPHAPAGLVRLELVGEIVWGIPAPEDPSLG